MKTEQIRFDDGKAYERYMGRWSQLVGDLFIDWLDLPTGLRWLDVGCGNGAFTETLVTHCAPASVDGVDPSVEQLAYARLRPSLSTARFQEGDAMALPYADDAFDVAVMPLVIFFVPTPARGVAEMLRVVSPGGMVAAYAWDMPGGGFPYDALHAEMRALDIPMPAPPSIDACRTEVMRSLWLDVGLQAVETRVLVAERTFDDFDDYWATALGAPSVGPILAAMTSADHDAIRERVRQRLPLDASGRLVCRAWANAVKGRVPV